MEPEATETAFPPVDLPCGLQAVDRLVLALTKAAVCAVGVAFLVMVTLDVVLRFVIKFSIPQANGTARVMLVWFFLLGAGLALRQGAHVGLEFFTTRLPRGPATALFVVAQALMLVFFLQMLWAGTVALAASFSQIEGSLGISMAWVMASFPIGFALLLYHQLALALSAYRSAGKEAAAS